MIVHRAFKYRIYPTPTQVERLTAWDHALRFLWNIANEQRETMRLHCKVDRRPLSSFGQDLELTDLRAMLPWLAEVPRNVSKQLLTELDGAWERFFVGVSDRPRFKRKGVDRAPIKEPHPRQFRVEPGAIVFPKLGAIRAIIHRPLQGTRKTCAIVRDGDQWFASIVCDVEAEPPAPSTKPAVAIDRGVVNVIADSNRRVVENPRHADKIQPRIARAQRAVAHKKKGSNNKKKANAKVARLQRKARRQREHFLHVESHHYAKSHGVVIVEALKIKNMTRSAKGTVAEPGANVAQKSGLSRGILGSGWGRLVELLRYKVAAEGGRVIEVPPAYSSQTCSACGVVDPESRRAQDVFLCSCGHFDNADINAAQVLLVRGISALAVEATVTVCGGLAARGRPVKQKRCVARRITRRASAAKVALDPTR